MMDQRPNSSTEQADLRELIEYFAGDMYCPLCGQPYPYEGIRVARDQDTNISASQHERRYTLSMQCDCCGTGSSITAAVPRRDHLHGEQSAPELTPLEVLRFAVTPPVTVDDVLDIHVFLKHFRGDFSGLDGPHRGA
jgi:hypothetical protein